MVIELSGTSNAGYPRFYCILITSFGHYFLFILLVNIYCEADKESKHITGEDWAVHSVVLGIVRKDCLMTAKTDLTWHINLTPSLR
jgi:hypothetical protein